MASRFCHHTTESESETDTNLDSIDQASNEPAIVAAGDFGDNKGSQESRRQPSKSKRSADMGLRNLWPVINMRATVAQSFGYLVLVVCKHHELMRTGSIRSATTRLTTDAV